MAIAVNPRDPGGLVVLYLLPVEPYILLMFQTPRALFCGTTVGYIAKSFQGSPNKSW